MTPAWYTCKLCGERFASYERLPESQRFCGRHSSGCFAGAGLTALVLAGLWWWLR